MEEPPTESVMSPYVHAQGQSCTSFSDFWIYYSGYFPQQKSVSACVVLSPKKSERRGKYGKINDAFCYQEKASEVNNSCCASFPSVCPGWHPARTLWPRELQCGTACIWQAESDTQCAECQFVKYPKWGIAEQRDAEAPALSSLSGRSLPLQARHLSSPQTHRGTQQPIPLFQNTWLILCCQVSLPPRFWKCLLGYPSQQ